MNRGKPGGGRGGHQQQQRPTSRHMVPRGLGLAFLGCFEELDRELCEPKIRAYMEQQVNINIRLALFTAYVVPFTFLSLGHKDCHGGDREE